MAPDDSQSSEETLRSRQKSKSSPQASTGENFSAVFCCLIMLGAELWSMPWWRSQWDGMLWIVGLLGIASGLIVGILTSPQADNERTDFSGYAKIGSGFLTGFIVSKADRVFDVLMTDSTEHAAWIASEIVQTRLIFATTCFFLAAIAMFTGRRYGLK